VGTQKHSEMPLPISAGPADHIPYEGRFSEDREARNREDLNDLIGKLVPLDRIFTRD